MQYNIAIHFLLQVFFSRARYLKDPKDTIRIYRLLGSYFSKNKFWKRNYKNYIDNILDLVYAIWMINEIYIHSSSETVFHNFTVYLTKIMLEGRHSNVKVMEILDFPKDDLNQFCTEKIGVSPFSKRPDELKLIQGLIEEYAYKIMESSDPLWWVRKASEQTSRLIEEFPGVTVAMGGVDKKHYISFLKDQKKKIIGLKLEEEGLPLGVDLENAPILELSQDFKLSNPEEIKDTEIEKVESFLKKIELIQC